MEPRQACFVDKLDDVTILLTACRSNRHDTFDEAAAFFALRPKADLSPKNSLTDFSFGCVVRRFDTFMVDKSPEMLCFGKNALAYSGHRTLTTYLSLDEKVFHLDTQIYHSPLESTAAHGPVSNPVPPLEHQVGLVNQLLAYLACLASQLGKTNKRPQQMCPTKLAQAIMDTIGSPTVGHKNTLEASKQLLGRFPTSAQMYHEYRDSRCDCHPEPGLLVALTPTGLVGVHDLFVLCIGMSLLDRVLDRFTDFLLACRDRTEADVESEDVCHEALDESLTLMVYTREQGNHRLCSSTEVASRNTIRQLGMCYMPAVQADCIHHLPLRDKRPDLWNIPDLMTPRARVIEFQIDATTSLASAGFDDIEVVHLVDRDEISIVSFMTGLATTLSFRLLLATIFLGLRRIGRWWFGGIARVHPQPSLQFLNSCEQRQHQIDQFLFCCLLESLTCQPLSRCFRADLFSAFHHSARKDNTSSITSSFFPNLLFQQ